MVRASQISIMMDFAVLSSVGIKRVDYIKPRSGLKLFDQMIKPILCYASEIWSVFDISQSNRKFQTLDGLAKHSDSLMQSNLNGSNIFGTMVIRSRHG